MEAFTDLILSLIVAGAVVSLYAILRLAFRSMPIESDLPAYLAAVLLTFAFAGSLFYAGLGLAGVLPGWVAFFGTFALHAGLVWVFQTFMPLQAKSDGTARRPQMASQQTV